MSNNNPNEQIRSILDQLKLGSALIRIKGHGNKSLRRLFLDQYENFLFYHRNDQTSGETHRYHIGDINEIRLGFQTLTFSKLLRDRILSNDEEGRAFAIVYNNYRDELHFLTDNEQTRNQWIQGLKYLIENYSQKRQRHLINDQKWILNHLRMEDKDRSNTMSKRECQRVLTDLLNVEMNQNKFEEFFCKADHNGDEILSSNEFLHFFHLVTRREDLFQVMIKYVKNPEEQTIETIVINCNELLYFLRHVQKQNLLINASKEDPEIFQIQPVTTLKQVQQLIDEYEPNEKCREEHLLSFDGFQNLLLSDDFSLMKPWCARHVYQDMTRPLTDYYINTSHNTYLFDNQLIGDSNPEAYNRALRSGCRSVELDCHDGADGQPMVKHGFTLVKSCSFQSILRLIEPNLFLASPYPVILDLENHCSPKQQKEMARILKEVLGDRLITRPITTKNSSVLPSPADLKYKVLLRGVRHSSSETISKIFVDEHIDDDKSPAKPQSKIIEQNLADLFVYLQNVPFELKKETVHCCQSSSLSEGQCEQIADKYPLELIAKCQKSIVRMYPGGLRQDSSNPNPILPWNLGIQLVALNQQTEDDWMAIYSGKFRDNGGCGYVLKANYLIDSSRGEFHPFQQNQNFDVPQRLTVTIISAQFLSRSKHDETDIPDPYVVISTDGLFCDCQRRQTRFLENNGLNPIWNETFQFDIKFPQLCLVRFDVYDYDIFSHDDRLLYFSLPFSTIQSGYRHIHLKSKDHRSTFSSLFVQINIENIVDR